MSVSDSAQPVAEELRPELPSAPPMAGENAGARRVIAGFLAMACLGVLGLAAIMEPAAEGVGTHRQFNLPECGWIAMADLPCPTCGMTTAFAHAANGNLLASFHTQPMGALLATATAMTLLLGAYIALTGSPIAGVFGRLWGRWTIWYIAAIAVAAWVYKILSYRGML